MKVSLTTPLIELHQYEIAGLSSAMSRKLAMAASNFAYKNDLAEVTVEDLLSYFPMRYEDRSNFMQIDQLVAETRT
jgi:RecG-like helicase